MITVAWLDGGIETVFGLWDLTWILVYTTGKEKGVRF
jgi:hypothetical protein